MPVTLYPFNESGIECRPAPQATSRIDEPEGITEYKKSMTSSRSWCLLEISLNFLLKAK